LSRFSRRRPGESSGFSVELGGTTCFVLAPTDQGRAAAGDVAGPLKLTTEHVVPFDCSPSILSARRSSLRDS
jgi:hypothetical protein